jgi:hypothetical protein
MMRAKANEDTKFPTFAADQHGGKVCAGVFMSSRAALIVLVLTIVLAEKSRAATTLTISQAPTGIAFTGTGPYASQFGTMDGLGISTAAPGVQKPLVLTNGALYYTPYQLTSTVNGNHTLTVSAVIKTNFTGNAASAMVLESCPSNSTCNTSGVFSAMSTTTPVTVMPGTANNNAPITVTAALGIFIPDNDGASAFTGTGTVSITFTLLDENNNKVATAEIDLNSPAGETINSAIQLTLGTAGGLTVSPGAGTDYAVDFGTVNGLGIGPGAGLTVNNVSGGVVYATPYLLQPAYTDQAKSTATITVKLTANFAHPTVLQLDDAGSATGPFTQITTTPITITSTAASRTPITRYLGLFVSNTNGAGAFTGSDTATLTFTMTVP